MFKKFSSWRLLAAPFNVSDLRFNSSCVGKTWSTQIHLNESKNVSTHKKSCFSKKKKKYAPNIYANVKVRDKAQAYLLSHVVNKHLHISQSKLQNSWKNKVSSSSVLLSSSFPHYLCHLSPLLSVAWFILSFSHLPSVYNHHPVHIGWLLLILHFMVTLDIK